MKKYTFILSFLLISTNIFGETNIFGHWLTSGSIVKIENCDDYICAKIETLFVEDGVDPKQILDDQNKDKKKFTLKRNDKQSYINTRLAPKTIKNKIICTFIS